MRPTQSLSRRNFLQGVLGGTLSSAAGLAAAQEAFAGSLKVLETAQLNSREDPWQFDGGFWAKVREQFMLEDGFGYLNTGTLGPTSIPVYDAMVEYWRLMAVNPHENSLILQAKQEELRHKAAKFLDASPDEIAITRNTTEGNTILCHGLDLPREAEILISAFEHNSVKQTWFRRAKREGFRVKEVSYHNPPSDLNTILNAFDGAITPRTKVIHIANPTGGYGCFQPAKELVKLAHSKGLLIFIDGAHAVGMIQFSLRDWGVDGFACNAHKWLSGPAGSGILFVRREVQDQIWPNIAIHSGDPVGARKYDEQVGRRPWPVVASLEHTLDFQLAVGRDRIERRSRALGSYLRENAPKISKVKLYTSTDPVLSAGITTIGIESVSGRRLADYLRQRHDIYVPGGGDTVRFSTHYYNTFEQVDRVVRGLAELASGVA